VQTATDRTRNRIAKALASNNTPTRRNRKQVAAYINHGRWVADCPCNGAELVGPGEDMVCGSCGTISSVDFPDTAADIEKVLGLRDPYNQNWHPGETVDELTAQNIENGLW
jgi:hypothetical protein